MIEYLKSVFAVGEEIIISGSEGKMKGKIEAFGNDFLVLRKENGEICGVKEVAISSFAKPSSTEEEAPFAPQPQQVVLSDEKEVAKKEEPEFKEFKPGDKIPLDELKQRDPSLADSWRRHEKKQQWERERQKALMRVVASALGARRAEDEKVVPPIGAIMDLKLGFKFGFIDDMQTGERYFFNRDDMVDAELANMQGEQIEVVYKRMKNHKGPAARSVHRPRPVRELLLIVLDNLEQENLIPYMGILDNVLTVFPENKSAREVLEVYKSFEEERKSYQTEPRRNNYDKREDYMPQEVQQSEYKQARWYMQRKNFDQALEYYFRALGNGERVVNCIKEITQVYISMYLQERDARVRERTKEMALGFIEKHKSELPDEMSTLFSLENIYFALGDFQNHRVVVDEILEESYETEDWARYIFYQNKSAQNFLRTGDYEAANRAVEDGLRVEGDNPHLLKTKRSIAEAQAEGNYEDEEDSYRFSKYY